jgi:hypothetical protein
MIWSTLWRVAPIEYLDLVYQRQKHHTSDGPNEEPGITQRTIENGRLFRAVFADPRRVQMRCWVSWTFGHLVAK